MSLLKAVPRGKFKRQSRLMERRGKNMDKLRDVITQLASGAQLPYRYHDHALTGNWKGFRECHIEPDWLLIYQIDGTDLILERTGTHSDLF